MKRLTWLGLVVLCALAAFHLVGRARPPGEIVAVRRGVIGRNVFAEGKVRPRREVEIAAKVPGRISLIRADEGEAVSAGSVVVQLDDEELRAELRKARTALGTAQAHLAELLAGARPQEIARTQQEAAGAEAALKEARLERQRVKALQVEGFASKQALDQAESRLTQAEAAYEAALAQLDLLIQGPRAETIAHARAKVEEARALVQRAEASLSHTSIKTPIAGRVMFRYREPGEYVHPGEPILLVGDFSRTLVRAEVLEEDAGKIRRGAEARVTAEAFPGKVFDARVETVAEAVGKRKNVPEDPSTPVDVQVLEVDLVVESPAGLKANMKVEVEILTEKPRGLVIPLRAVHRGPDGHYVEVWTSRRARRRAVEVGPDDGVSVQVVSGLAPGERVVVRKKALGPMEP